MLFVMILGLFLCFCQKKTTPWSALFDGKTLNGWHRKGGKAIYEVKDGMIIGNTVQDRFNTFLATKTYYKDFILELEFWVDSGMNSGIQIRSNRYPYYKNGVVHGYQVEIDPSERAWSGGIYDESRRGWLAPLVNNPKAQKAFKHNDWNHYRVEAIGDTIKTWINKVPAAFLVDDATHSGFIALQVHGISPDKKPTTKVRWRNIRIIDKDVAKYSTHSSLEPVYTLNKLTFEDKRKGWSLLWDGKTTDGWTGIKQKGFPTEGWQIKNGELMVLETGGKESEAGGDIITKDKYADFELKLEFKISQGANSGIKYYVDPAINKGKGSAIGLEYQILDDKNHEDAHKGNHKGSRTVGSLYDLIKADESKHMNPIGQWNTARIVSKESEVTHYLNGKKVVSYKRASKAFRKLVANSKYSKWKNFGELQWGYILLQDHGNKVSFRNIKIKKY